MAIYFNDLLRNALLAAIEAYAGTSPTVEVWSGTVPANEAATPAGTLLATLTTASDWLAAPSGGVAAKAGTWTGAAVATGTATFIRMTTSGSAVFFQCSLSGDGATIDNAAIVSGQTVTVTTFTLTAPG